MSLRFILSCLYKSVAVCPALLSLSLPCICVCLYLVHILSSGSIFILSLIFPSQGAYILSDLWLAFWSEEEEKRQFLNITTIAINETVRDFLSDHLKVINQTNKGKLTGNFEKLAKKT